MWTNLFILIGIIIIIFSIGFWSGYMFNSPSKSKAIPKKGVSSAMGKKKR